MKLYRFSESYVTKIGLGVFLFALLMLSRDTLVFSSLLGMNTTYAYTLCLLGLVGFLFLLVNRKYIKDILLDKRILLLLVSTFVILMPMLLKRDWQLMYFSILLCLYVAVFVSYFMMLQEVSRYFVVFMVILSIWSILATYLLRILPDKGLMEVPIITNPVGYQFYNFGFAFVSMTAEPDRNWGIFREPGVYQYFLIIAIYLNNYNVNWEKKQIQNTANVILAVSVLLTQSTNGVIELVLFVVVLFFDRGYHKNAKLRVVALICTCLLILAIVYSILTETFLFYYLKELFSKIINMTPSTTHRLDAIFTDLKIFLLHPILGEKMSTVLHSVIDNTTSTLIMLAVFGVIGGGFHILGWIIFVWEKDRHILINLSYMMIVFMTFNFQSLNVNIFFWMFPMMAMVEKGLPLLERAKLPQSKEAK